MAGLAALMLLVATQAYAAVNGNIDMVDANSRLIAGWACTVGNSSPVAVEVWSGDSTTDSGARQLGIYNADQPSEPGVASACQSTGQNHRFRIGITSEMIAGAGGRPVYVYVIGKSGGALGGSGRWTLPATGDYPYVETITFIHTDRLGSTLMESDALGNVSQQADYAPFGANLTNPKEAPGYTGHYEDPTTGLTYMQSRYYDSAVGRFISVDPASVDPGDTSLFNRYAYVGNRPLNYVDPDGRAAQGVAEKDKEKARDLDGFVVTAANAGSGGAPIGAGGGGGGGAKTLASVNVTADIMEEPYALSPSWKFTQVGGILCSKTAASIAGGAVGGAVTGGLTGLALGKSPYAIGVGVASGAAIGGGSVALSKALSAYVGTSASDTMSSIVTGLISDPDPATIAANGFMTYAASKFGWKGPGFAMTKQTLLYVGISTTANRGLGAGAFVAGPMIGMAGSYSHLAAEAGWNNYCGNL